MRASFQARSGIQKLRLLADAEEGGTAGEQLEDVVDEEGHTEWEASVFGLMKEQAEKQDKLGGPHDVSAPHATPAATMQGPLPWDIQVTYRRAPQNVILAGCYS
jgi:hypothetical protein